MRQAALLAENSQYVLTFDTGGTAAGAAAAAGQALRKKPALILGPLSAEEVPAVSSSVAGRVPIIAFSNDAVLRTPGTYIFGITARQLTSAILRYARSRGVKNVAVIDDGSPWSAAAGRPCSFCPRRMPKSRKPRMRVRMTLVSLESSEPSEKTAASAVPPPSNCESCTDTLEYVPQTFTPYLRTRLTRTRCILTSCEPSKTAIALPPPVPGPPPSIARFAIRMCLPLAISSAQ
jgi:hypothetical protein